ncbi:uncharacterized protein LOC127803256 [Diospyros lotus]|uniref:uncharacterized protein LOC127803256 n=1 Tax=Diospyros lotus TaxID=55363 RepID=UPI00224F5DAB|nr:uncharacterized protein LOC127803256 [Diospyros lotus]
MEASARIFNSSALNRHFSSPVLLRARPLKRHGVFPVLPPCRQITVRPKPFSIRCSTRFIAPPFPPSSGPLGFFQSLSAYQSTDYSFSKNFDPIVSDSKEKYLKWNFASELGDSGLFGERGPAVTVVLLGWLGAKPKHLKRYAELYTSRGIHAVTFVAPVADVLSFDLGRKLQERISALAAELGSWLSETETDGRDRFLLFHTFSNTGWLAYGAILENLQHRQDLLMKIKGCVVDSGGDPDINPKVWAAGFTAALLKKRGSSVYPSAEAEEGMESEARLSKRQGGPLSVEIMLLLVFEKLFSFLLNLPDVNERLTNIICTLRKNQPPCPQLYLYSTADKVIPWQSVESFIEEQRRMGREARSSNLGSSPHVDHYRTFPDMYSSLVQNFLRECLAMEGKLLQN